MRIRLLDLDVENEWLYVFGFGSFFLSCFGILVFFFPFQLTQTGILAAMVLVGALNRVPAVVSKLRGFEIWLPFAIIASFAVGPWAGIAVGVLSLAISQVLIPDYPPGMVVAVIVVAVVGWYAGNIGVGPEGLVYYGMLMSGLYNLITNPIYLLWGQDKWRMVRFIALSMWIDYLVYRELGSYLFSILS